MNVYKLTGPDSGIGRLALAGRARVQLLGLRLRGKASADPEFVRLVRLLVPRYSMLSLARLQKLYAIGGTLATAPCAGAVVECGVWNGGSSAALAAGWRRAAPGRDTPPFWLFDSFAGLPEPTENDEDRVRKGYFPGWCTGSVERVREAHRAVGHGLDRVTIVPGWFEDTLAEHADAIGPIALLHIDADWYDSVRCVLETLYPQVAPGGLVVIDDYGSWSGCRKAVEAYFGANALASLQLTPIDRHAVFFRKPAPDGA